MDDEMIVSLFWARDERAVEETKIKYGALCRGVAMRILGVREDAEEAENDAYLKAWNTIPPNKPSSVAAYLVMLCRQIAIDKLKAKTSAKRGGGVYDAALDELAECVSDPSISRDPVDSIALRDALNVFLGGLPEKPRRLFMQRYWWSCTIEDIAYDSDMSESAVKISLFRTREKLKKYLQKEGFDI